jgi:hypothetical protein
MALRKQILENTQVMGLPVRNNFLYHCKIDGYCFSAQTRSSLTWETQNHGGQIRDTIQNKKEFVDCIYHWLNVENA